MELGTGIFLASLVIGFVFLFHTTKDRWNWKKIMMSIGIVALLGVCALVIAIYERPITQFFESKTHSPSVKVAKQNLRARLLADAQLIKFSTELNGIKLGSDARHVQFLHGKPTATPQWGKAKTWWWIWGDQKGTADKLYGNNINVYGNSIWVAFKGDNKIIRVRQRTNDHNDCLNTVCSGDNIKVMERKLGPFDSFSSNADYTLREYNYQKLNSVFFAEKGKVTGFEIGKFTK